MIEIALRDELDAHPLEVAEIAHCQLLRKAHFLAGKEQRYQNMPRGKTEAVGAGEMIVEARAGIAAFDFAKPADTHTKLTRQIALRQAPLLPCLFNLSSRLHFDVQDWTFGNGSR
ncbi:hypothetical protein FHT60_000122 [Novosphingobium sp. BK486]|nr:hypothetical protein [Novosphingobium sp. BK256]MBB3373422.1 hypothetical protein [Novosphingobium sp. BK280]MBB3377791.1 hypothetical protein [Novosphingobium sp. BK258]MBB3418798.1 hypothetical protein [Novosphingobium sp. BK267]MBB3450367.1 hypothetical protein [Novosphingobium sp. BK352]MBB3476707.1 hypothetical protein [Novosphingobium sp. BK369]MBB3499280.1 hypothetical protein [Novosphingobium sp. BK336]MBB3535065.1 hypothetical protein [Novosphingobium sp. BK486]MBB3554462.1 hypo